jgi:HD-GYP domain-containing protein (c-di-GMP phosphodiesterase class II)
MDQNSTREKLVLEIMLIIVCLGISCLLFVMQGYKMVVLNLFFLPVALGSACLGRYRAGVMALFCIVTASLVMSMQLGHMTTGASPLVIALAVAVWAAALGLTAMLIGVLSDDRTRKVQELHEAYVGVVEVLSQYLQSAHPKLKARSIRVAELSQRVAAKMKRPPAEIDDIRVAALLYDMGNIEVTTSVIRRAVGAFEDETAKTRQRTFQGSDLMLSLGAVLNGAVPLLLNQEDHLVELRMRNGGDIAAEIPVGARIIRAARAYWALADKTVGGHGPVAAEIVARLRRNRAANHDPDVLNALESVLLRSDQAAPQKTDSHYGGSANDEAWSTPEDTPSAAVTP